MVGHLISNVRVHPKRPTRAPAGTLPAGHAANRAFQIETEHFKMKPSISNWNRAFHIVTKHFNLKSSISNGNRACQIETEHFKLKPSISNWNRAFQIESEHFTLKPSISNWNRAFDFETEHFKLKPSISTCARTGFQFGKWRTELNHLQSQAWPSKARPCCKPRLRHYEP